MFNFEIVSIGCGEDGFVLEVVKFDDIEELSEKDLLLVKGFVGFGNSGEISWNDLVDSEFNWIDEKVNVLFNDVNVLLDEMKKDGWYSEDCEERNNLEMEFLKMVGDRKGINWCFEYDNNVGVLLNGCWKELREIVYNYC